MGRGRKSFRRPREGGNVLILFALLLPMFMGLAALAVDIGFLYYVRTAMQATADAAALAGATGLTVSTDEATTRATTFGNTNISATPSLTGSGLSISFPDTTTISVTVSNPAVALFFGPVIGWSSAAVSATASAGISAVSSVTGSGIAPLTVYCPVTPCSALTPGTVMANVRVGCGKTGTNPCGGADFVAGENSFQAVYFDASWSSSDIGDYIDGTQTFAGTISVGDVLDVAHGNKNGILRPAIDARVGDVIVVPVVEQYSVSGANLTGVRVTGFYALEVTASSFAASEIFVSFTVRQYVVSTTSFSASSVSSASTVGVRLGG